MNSKFCPWLGMLAAAVVLALGFAHAAWPFSRALLMPQHWPVLALAALALVAGCASRRRRWFGATAPLIAAVIFAFAEGGLFALAFAALFVAGVLADLVQAAGLCAVVHF